LNKEATRTCLRSPIDIFSDFLVQDKSDEYDI